MFEGFLEMQSVVTRVQGRLELGGEQEYRRIEFGTERSCTRQNRVIGSETRKNFLSASRGGNSGSSNFYL